MARNKYGAQKVTLDGHRFDSRAEARRYEELRLLVMAGDIADLELQPKFVLQPAFKDEWSNKKERAVTYTGDFRYVEDGRVVVEDVKGRITDAFRVRWRWVKCLNKHIEFRIVKM